MNHHFFIWTVRRTGGSSLKRSLEYISECPVIEAEAFNSDRMLGYDNNEEKLLQRFEEIRGKHYCIKHCWELHEPKYNQMILDYAKQEKYRFILLTRKNILEMLISLELAYQTKVWGRNQIGNLSNYEQRYFAPLNINRMKKNYENHQESVKKYRNQFNQDKLPWIEVVHEKLYKGSKQERFGYFKSLCEFLDISQDKINDQYDLLRDELMNQKQNNFKIYSKIPNINEVQEEFPMYKISIEKSHSTALNNSRNNGNKFINKMEMEEIKFDLDAFSGIGPKFLVIGARKAATTWIYHYLQQHPDIRMPPIKEFNYFNTVFFKEGIPQEKIIDRWHRLIVQHTGKENVCCDPLIKLCPEAWYRYQFFDFDGRISGDVSPLYQDIGLPKIKKIAATLSDIKNLKIVYVVRSPVSRLRSDLNMKINLSGITQITDDNLQEMLRKEYSRSCDYNKVHSEWKSVFGKNYRLLFYEDLKLSPNLFTRKLSEHLNIKFKVDLCKQVKNPNKSKEVYGHFKFTDSQVLLIKKHVEQYMPDFINKVPPRLLEHYT